MTSRSIKLILTKRIVFIGKWEEMMKPINKFLLILTFGFFALFFISGVGIIQNEYLSPEHLYLDKENRTIYIGLSTFPGIASYSIQANEISKIIQMPEPVSGIIVDKKDNILYASSKGESGVVFGYDLNTDLSLEFIKVGQGPTALEIAESGRIMFVANRFSNDVSVVDLNTRREIKRIEAIREPVGLALSPKEDLLAVANLLPSQSSMDDYISASVN